MRGSTRRANQFYRGLGRFVGPSAIGVLATGTRGIYGGLTLPGVLLFVSAALALPAADESRGWLTRLNRFPNAQLIRASGATSILLASLGLQEICDWRDRVVFLTRYGE